MIQSIVVFILIAVVKPGVDQPNAGGQPISNIQGSPRTANLYDESLELNSCQSGQTYQDCSNGESVEVGNRSSRLGLFAPHSGLRAGEKVRVGVASLERGFIDSINTSIFVDPDNGPYAVYSLPPDFSAEIGELYFAIEGLTGDQPLLAAIQFNASGINIGNGADASVLARSSDSPQPMARVNPGSTATASSGCRISMSNQDPSNAFVLAWLCVILFSGLAFLRLRAEKAEY